MKTLDSSQRNLYLLATTSAILILAAKLTGPLFPFILTEKGGNALELGVILSLYSFTTLLSRLPLSILFDRIGRWLAFPAIIISFTTSLFLYAVAQNQMWFYPIAISAR
jgi:MFS family permease